ncbi:MAG TPA: TRAP transporter small permease [Burkholderiales bacterium]|nr:TRAP transporter small permease [Burkholderiales bacterium]
MVAATRAPRRGLGRALELLSQAFAFFGGAVFVGLIAMSATSITLRAVTGKPVQGDFEMVQFACAIGIAAFLPWCQLCRGNIIVDFFTTRLPPRGQAWLDAFGALLLALVMAIVAWRAGYGAQSVFASGERAMISRIPVWIPYAGVVPSLALTAVAALYTAWESLSRKP